MSPALRLSLFYAALFTGVGIHLPFWPLWLQDRGLGPAEIGLLAAAGYLTRIVGNPLVGHVVDRRGDRRLPMVVLAAAACVTWLGFALTGGFWSVLAVTLVAAGLWSAVMPVGESLSLMACSHYRLDYGRVRLWGSLAFILAASAVGRLLEAGSPAMLLWLVAGALALTTASCAALPDMRAPPHPDGGPATLRPLLASLPFVLFLTAASLNQAGHTLYYSFSSIHWKAAGIADFTIGLLWSEGVLAEIVLFAFSAPVVARLGPGPLLMLAGLGGVIRWLALGFSTELPVLAVAQVLHAATFGCAHLGAMHFIQRAVPSSLSARAQGVFASIAGGIAPGLMSPLSGRLYDSLGGHAFLVMAGFAALTALAAWKLDRHWHGGKITPA